PAARADAPVVVRPGPRPGRGGPPPAGRLFRRRPPEGARAAGGADLLADHRRRAGAGPSPAPRRDLPAPPPAASPSAEHAEPGRRGRLPLAASGQHPTDAAFRPREKRIPVDPERTRLLPEAGGCYGLHPQAAGCTGPVPPQ